MTIITLLAASASPFSYGYMGATTVLYSDPQCQNPITTLPATYFVIVLSEDDEVFKVNYKDVVGYAKNIEVVDYEPVTKYAASSFEVSNDGYPTKLRAQPSDKSEILIEIPPNKGGYYYGDAEGSALVPDVGGKWHYVSYDDGDKTYYGYVYASQVKVDKISANVIEKVEHNNEGEEISSSPVNNTDFLLIAILCVPSVLIMYLIFRDREKKSRYKE